MRHCTFIAFIAGMKTCITDNLVQKNIVCVCWVVAAVDVQYILCSVWLLCSQYRTGCTNCTGWTSVTLVRSAAITRTVGRKCSSDTLPYVSFVYRTLCDRIVTVITVIAAPVINNSLCHTKILLPCIIPAVKVENQRCGTIRQFWAPKQVVVEPRVWCGNAGSQ